MSLKAPTPPGAVIVLAPVLLNTSVTSVSLDPIAPAPRNVSTAEASLGYVRVAPVEMAPDSSGFPWGSARLASRWPAWMAPDARAAAPAGTAPVNAAVSVLAVAGHADAELTMVP